MWYWDRITMIVLLGRISSRCCCTLGRPTVLVRGPRLAGTVAVLHAITLTRPW
jgi:hypothetical protein